MHHIDEGPIKSICAVTPCNITTTMLDRLDKHFTHGNVGRFLCHRNTETRQLSTAEREGESYHTSNQKGSSRARPAARRLQARGYNVYLGNDVDVQCMCAGMAIGAGWRQRPERHRCTQTRHSCMQAIIHTSMAITASKLCTRCSCPHHRPTYAPLKTSSRTVSKTGRCVHP